MEALSCGTPCVAFDVGGMKDMIDHQKNGYLAKPYDADEFAGGIYWILADEVRRCGLADQARDKVVKEFGTEHVAGQHLKLYEDLVSASKVRVRVAAC
jgi:glycosyltransferase involved in cell wall biosynthesis